MHSFSVGYPGRPVNDERNNARVLADLLQMPFHEIELETSDLVRDFEEMNYHRDDPIADISGFGYYSISKAAREEGIQYCFKGKAVTNYFGVTNGCRRLQ